MHYNTPAIHYNERDYWRMLLANYQQLSVINGNV